MTNNYLPIDHWSFSIRFIVAVAILTVINCFLFPWKVTLDLMIEGGIVENVTILAYYLTLASLWLFPPRAMSRLAILASSLLLLAAAARELDLHKEMFGMSMLKTNFYRDFASGTQIAIALLILLPVFLSIFYLAFAYGKRLITAVRSKNAAAVTVLSMFVFLVLLKIFDSAIGMIGAALSPPGEIWGYTTPMGLITMALEETLELILPLMIIIALIQDRRAQAMTPKRN